LECGLKWIEMGKSRVARRPRPRPARAAEVRLASGSRIVFFLPYMNRDQLTMLVHGKLLAEPRTIPRLPSSFLSEDPWFS